MRLLAVNHLKKMICLLQNCYGLEKHVHKAKTSSNSYLLVAKFCLLFQRVQPFGGVPHQEGQPNLNK